MLCGSVVIPHTRKSTVHRLHVVWECCCESTAKLTRSCLVLDSQPSPPAIFCAHVVVVNLDESNPLLFQYTLGGRGPPNTTVGSAPLTSERIFGLGNRVKRNVTSSDGERWESVTEWLGPSETGIYRIGCDTTSAVPAGKADARVNLAAASSPSAEATSRALQRAPGWSLPGYGGIDPLTSIVSDTAVAAKGRHSARLLIPNSKPVVLPLSGTQVRSDQD